MQSAWWLGHFYLYNPEMDGTQARTQPQINEHVERVEFSETIVSAVENLEDSRNLNITNIHGQTIGKVSSDSLVQMIRNTQEFMQLLIDFAVSPGGPYFSR